MQQTANLDLELYEATDNANLLDGYNSSMRKIDTRDGEISTLITALGTSVTNLDTRVTTAQSTADGAASAASTADGKAVSAQTDATAALTALAGVSLDFIHNTDKGTKWSTITDTHVDPTKTIFEGIVFTAGQESILMAHLGVQWSSSDTVAVGSRAVISLRDWQLVEAGDHEVYEAYGYLDAMQSGRMLFQAGSNHYEICLNNVKQITGTVLGDLSGVIIAPVIPRATS